jgi:hypothetical protein
MVNCMIPTRNNPHYVQRSINSLTMSTPALAKGVTLYFFPVASDVEKQQEVCDKFLNEPSNGASNYRAFFPQVFFFFARYGSLQSLVPPDSDRGAVQYLEGGIWIPTLLEQMGAQAPFASHLAVFPYYMFVDSGAPLTVGRELQGWNKEWAKMGVPESPDSANELSISPVIIKKFGPKAYGSRATLIKFTRTGNPANDASQLIWTEGRAALKAIKNVVFRDPGPCIPGFAFSILEVPIKGLTFTFLKQFRDIKRPHHACYQSGVETHISVRKFGALGTLNGEYHLDITEAQSHPLVAQMGLDENTFSRVQGFFVQMDFVLHTGLERWRAP